jgi:hypothetical protein
MRLAALDCRSSHTTSLFDKQAHLTFGPITGWGKTRKDVNRFRTRRFPHQWKFQKRRAIFEWLLDND